MDKILRDRGLLIVFLTRLHNTGALSVPPEDLDALVDEVAELYSGLEELLGVLVTIEKESNE